MRISDLNPNSSEPIYRQIYRRLREAIASGLLTPGDRVPAARSLAKELGLARSTVDSAYSLLTSQGYLQARGQAGTFVATGVNASQATLISLPLSKPSPSTEDTAGSRLRVSRTLGVHSRRHGGTIPE